MEIKENFFVARGRVLQARGNANFLVKVEDLDNPVSCTLKSNIKKNSIKIIEGDDVQVEVSTYDPSRGRISYRMKG